MSMDAGGLAQMTYNPSFNNGIGVPGSGFASRGKGSHIKRLSVAPPKIATIDENHATPTPRTSRSHLLAGLRTAPKTPSVPSTAPLSQPQQRFGLDNSRYAHNHTQGRAMPQTATGASFPHQTQQRLGINSNGQLYSVPEQILAPPEIQFDDLEDDSMDPGLYEQLLAQNLYLAEQRVRLQQQLLNAQAVAQQFGGMSLNSNVPMMQQHQQHQQYMQSPISPNVNMYQQFQNSMQPIVQAVPNQPGLYSVYNPLTGQQQFVFDNAQQAQYTGNSQQSYENLANSPPPPTPTFQVSPPPESTASPVERQATTSPPKSSASPPQDVTPLPPPSANAFRRGHKKSLSFAPTVHANNDGPQTANGSKSAGFPQTPVTGSFGPGQARAGEHPVRQPRGPPPMDELKAKPTSKHEGSKNFASRQRSRALNNLVRAGLERRVASRNGSTGSVETTTPASEREFAFSVTSSDDGGSLSSKPSFGSLRAAANGAIGSEMKEKERSRSRGSMGTRNFSSNSLSSDEGLGGKLVDVKVQEVKQPEGRRRTPLLVLTSAEKRKSSVY